MANLFTDHSCMYGLVDRTGREFYPEVSSQFIPHIDSLSEAFDWAPSLACQGITQLILRLPR